MARQGMTRKLILRPLLSPWLSYNVPTLATLLLRGLCSFWRACQAKLVVLDRFGEVFNNDFIDAIHKDLFDMNITFPAFQSILLTNEFIVMATDLDLTDEDLGQILGQDAEVLGDVMTGELLIKSSDPAVEQIVQLVNIYKVLCRIMGGPESARDWLHAFNHSMEEVPLEVMKQPKGLSHIAGYLMDSYI